VFAALHDLAKERLASGIEAIGKPGTAVGPRLRLEARGSRVW
jgi:hypothetical protein